MGDEGGGSKKTAKHMESSGSGSAIGKDRDRNDVLCRDLLTQAPQERELERQWREQQKL